MKRNTTKKTDRKIAAQKNESKSRKTFRTGVKAGMAATGFSWPPQ